MASRRYAGRPTRLDLVGLPRTKGNVSIDALQVLFGVCGVGNGHRNRQTPLVRFLLQRGARVVIFTYVLLFCDFYAFVFVNVFVLVCLVHG